MAIVVVTFVVGGNVEKLVCEPYQNRKLFQVSMIFVPMKEGLEQKLRFPISCGFLQELCKKMSSLVFI